jgi:anti-anti-sigma factor
MSSRRSWAALAVTRSRGVSGLLYLTDRSDEATIRAYLDEVGVDSAHGPAMGQIEIRECSQADRAGAGLDPEAMVAGLEAERRSALEAGYGALAVTGEMSWSLARHADAEAASEYEREVSRIFGAAEITGRGQCDRRVFPQELQSRLLSVHPFHVLATDHAIIATRGSVTVCEREELMGVVLSGEIDITSAWSLAARLAERAGGEGDLVVETAELEFIDVAGCRMLVEAAERLGNGWRLRLPDAGTAMLRVLRGCGWADHPRLVFSSGAGELD